MANSSLIKKLKIGPGLRIVVLNPPAGYLDALGSLPEDVKLVTETEGQCDLSNSLSRTEQSWCSFCPGR